MCFPHEDFFRKKYTTYLGISRLISAPINRFLISYAALPDMIFQQKMLLDKYELTILLKSTNRLQTKTDKF